MKISADSVLDKNTFSLIEFIYSHHSLHVARDFSEIHCTHCSFFIYGCQLSLKLGKTALKVEKKALTKFADRRCPAGVIARSNKNTRNSRKMLYFSHTSPRAWKRFTSLNFNPKNFELD